MTTFLAILIILVWLKAVTVGSDFNFYYWLRYGKHYSQWYDNRPDYKPPEP